MQVLRNADSLTGFVLKSMVVLLYKSGSSFILGKALAPVMKTAVVTPQQISHGVSREAQYSQGSATTHRPINAAMAISVLQTG